MCGITAWLAAEGGEVDLGVLDRMTDALAHRGPDGRGTWLARPTGRPGPPSAGNLDRARPAPSPWPAPGGATT